MGAKIKVIDEERIWRQLENGKKRGEGEILAILQKALQGKGIEPDEVAILLQTEGPELNQEIFRTAREVKTKIYGKRLVFFAPLYLSNHCSNNCRYCGFRKSNSIINRKRLTFGEIQEQVRYLEALGHKRLLLECGESHLSDIDYVAGAVDAIYGTKNGRGEIRRVNVNIAATTIENYRRLKAAGIGTYQLFQETYHRATYETVHEGPKRDYDRQIFAHDRAQEAGIDDIGLGVLFGLFDYKFEVMALSYHALYLEKKFGVGPHTISVPRWRPAPGVKFHPDHSVVDEDFKRLIAIIRLAVPYTGMIISTRESVGMRTEAFALGISQTSAGSCTAPGGYGPKEEGLATFAGEQFAISDPRTPDEVIRSVCQMGYIPSFCTACYRKGRTGESFMDLAKPGEIQELCGPNAILTFYEYLLDYGTLETRQIGKKVITDHLKGILNKGLREKTQRGLDEIEKGGRDIYF